MTDRVEAGDAAPAFSMPTDGGGSTALTDLKGTAVVLYFYPRDDTPGCTKEAIAFTGLIGDFRAAGATVIGVSKDTVAKHDKFKTKYDLDVVLAADEDGSVCAAYGVWVEKNMYGKKSMGIERSTFLIDKDGKLAQVWRKVKVPDHAEEVLEAVKAL
ncbi:MAG: peroxiredoxin [Minwuia sp.]|nr:peroxiredoxin [Minwuia sp.]